MIRLAVSFVATFLVLAINLHTYALSFTTLNDSVEINFDDYQGTGFQPGGGGGTLDSEVVSAQLYVNDADFNPVFADLVSYGDTKGPGEFGRGISTTLPSEFGLFSLDLGGGDYALAGKSFQGQPDESFSAYIEVRILNDTGVSLSQFHLEYDLLYWNSADSSLYADGHIGSNDEGFSDVGVLLYETLEVADDNPTWMVEHFSAIINLPYFGFDLVEPVEPGEYFVVGLSVGPFTNSGLYDSVGWNNIRITILPEPGTIFSCVFGLAVALSCRRYKL